LIEDPVQRITDPHEFTDVCLKRCATFFLHPLLSQAQKTNANNSGLSQFQVAHRKASECLVEALPGCTNLFFKILVIHKITSFVSFFDKNFGRFKKAVNHKLTIRNAYKLDIRLI